MKEGQPLYGRASLALVRGARIHLAFTWEKLSLLTGLACLAESPRLITFIFPRNSESDICVHVLFYKPTHKQTELVK